MRLLAFVAMLFTVMPALAWGTHAHRVAAKVAESDLPDDVKREVRTILRGKSLSDLAAKADEWLVTKPESRAWHFVSIPLDQRGYSAVRDCGDGNCIVAAIEKFEAVLADRGQSAAKREEALIYLTHLVADVHQPLHVSSGKNDRGGNTVKVMYRRQSTSLHAFWDQGIFDRNVTVDAHAAQLIALKRRSAKEIRTLSSGTPERWANESHLVSQQFVYEIPSNGALTDKYVADARNVIDKQLLRASQRLRTMLIRALEDD